MPLFIASQLPPTQLVGPDLWYILSDKCHGEESIFVYNQWLTLIHMKSRKCPFNQNGPTVLGVEEKSFLVPSEQVCDYDFEGTDWR